MDTSHRWYVLYHLLNPPSSTRTHLFTPGLGADGPCLTKDPEIFRYSAKRYNLKTEMTDGCLTKNENSTMRLVDIMLNFIKENNLEKPKISMVGLAFKGFPETDDLRGSPAFKLHKELEKRRINVEFDYYDPLVKRFLDKDVNGSVERSLENSNIVLFLTNHPHLMNLEKELILERGKRPLLIIDCWGNIKDLHEINEEGVKVFRIGNGAHSNYIR